MARSAASSIPNYIGNSDGRRYKNRFAGDPLQSAGYTFGGEAAGNVDLASTFAGIRESSPDYQDLASTGAEIRIGENMARNEAIADVVGAKFIADGQIEGALARAKGIKSAGESQKTASIFSGFGSLALGAVSLFSDEDTKHTIDEIDDALDTLRKLRPVTFYYKEEYTENPHLMHHGFIAQEYQKVMPDATYVDSFTGKLCIDTMDLIALLVRANQQLESRITRLEVKQALTAV